jgi:hypothetical protein
LGHDHGPVAQVRILPGRIEHRTLIPGSRLLIEQRFGSPACPGALGLSDEASFQDRYLGWEDDSGWAQSWDPEHLIRGSTITPTIAVDALPTVRGSGSCNNLGRRTPSEELTHTHDVGKLFRHST